MTPKQARKEAASPSSKKPARRAPQSSPPRGRTRPAGASTDDPTFNVVSVLYHAMQGADTAGRYLQDVQESNQSELVSFFEETRAAYEKRVALAKTLLASMLSETTLKQEDEDSEEEDEDEDEEDEEEEDEDD